MLLPGLRGKKRELLDSSNRHERATKEKGIGVNSAGRKARRWTGNILLAQVLREGSPSQQKKRRTPWGGRSFEQSPVWGGGEGAESQAILLWIPAFS